MKDSDSQAVTPEPKRRWFRFSLTTLFLAMTLAAAPMIWLSVQISAIRSRDKLVNGEYAEINGERVPTIRIWGGGRWKDLPWIWRQLDPYLGIYPHGRIQLLESHWDEKGRARVQSLFPEADVTLVGELEEWWPAED